MKYRGVKCQGQQQQRVSSDDSTGEKGRDGGSGVVGSAEI